MVPFQRFIRIFAGIYLISANFLISSCKKYNPELPSITTVTITNISSTTATSGGIVTNDGGAPIVSKGVTWSTDKNLTVENNRTFEGGGSGSFISTITLLKPATLYYLKAYATNSSGTSYGTQTSFTTFLNDQTGSVSDAEGNSYATKVIGTQIWMTENLKATKYRNETDIPMVTSAWDWYNLMSPACCVYGNRQINKADYGVLYNWYAIDIGQDAFKNICPAGWHVPTDAEWNILTTYLGGDSVAVGKLKENGLTHWLEDNNDATNESGFTGRPGGARDYDGEFYGLGYYGGWWTSTEFIKGGAYCRFLGYDGSGGYSWGRFEQDGFSVRCIKNSTPTK